MARRKTPKAAAREAEATARADAPDGRDEAAAPALEAQAKEPAEAGSGPGAEPASDSDDSGTPDPVRPLRAPGHRDFLAPEFGGAGPLMGGTGDPVGLSYLEIMADPRLAALSRQVFDDLRRQFAQDPQEDEEEDTYRKRLEGWADALEILLEEVLDELASLRPPAATLA